MKFIITILLSLTTFILSSQSDSVYVIDLSDLENIVENQEIEDDIDIVNTLDVLRQYRENPININEATYDQLNFLQLLHDYQINALLSYRKNYGDLISIYELQAIPGWNILTIERVLPYITLSTRKIDIVDLKNMATKGKHTIFTKWKRVIEERAGFDNSRSPEYLGDPNHFFIRYRYNYNNKLRWGITAEKDAGEQLFTGNNPKGFDFYSGFINYTDLNSKIKSLSIGDYSISMGQGLIMHNSFGSGKSAQPINIIKGGQVLRPYSSVNEALYFRGGAITVAANDEIDITAFGSIRNINGTTRLDTIIEGGFESFSSIIPNGFHRTESEISKKGSVLQQDFGGVLTYRVPNLKLGLNYRYTSFDKPLDFRDDLYRRFRFQGERLQNFSADGTYRYKNINVFGELARSDNGGQALVIGSQFVLHPDLDLAILYRDYDINYQALNANAFAEASFPENEQGLYLGLEYRLNKKMKISAYHDAWKNPWLRFRVDAPGNGSESFLRFDYIEKRDFHVYAQYKYEEKPINLSGSTEAIRSPQLRKIHRLRVHFQHDVSPGLQLRNRIELSYFSLENQHSNGFLIYQDILFKPIGKAYSFTSRFALFDTDDFDSRIYAFENDILYEFRIPFYQNNGFRFYVNSKWRLTRSLQWEFRYERTQFLDRDEIGSSGETILGNIRSEIKTQIRYKF